jgi:hypothetical protein
MAPIEGGLTVSHEQWLKSAGERAKANQARLEKLSRRKRLLQRRLCRSRPRMTAKRTAEIEEQFEQLRQAQNTQQANMDYQGAAGDAYQQHRCCRT